MLAILLPPAGLRVPVTFDAVLVALALTGALSAHLGGSDVRRAVLRVVIGGALGLAFTYAVGHPVRHSRRLNEHDPWHAEGPRRPAPQEDLPAGEYGCRRLAAGRATHSRRGRARLDRRRSLAITTRESHRPRRWSRLPIPCNSGMRRSSRARAARSSFRARTERRRAQASDSRPGRTGSVRDVVARTLAPVRAMRKRVANESRRLVVVPSSRLAPDSASLQRATAAGAPLLRV